jgi:hypothetical protein
MPSTLHDWEQNRRHPDGAARVLLMVMDKERRRFPALAPVPGQKHIQKSTVSASVALMVEYEAVMIRTQHLAASKLWFGTRLRQPGSN